MSVFVTRRTDEDEDELGILVVGYIVKVKRFADFAQSAGKVCQS